ncbi:hypothetical protein D3C71_2135580 [compost metagenome]
MARFELDRAAYRQLFSGFMRGSPAFKKNRADNCPFNRAAHIRPANRWARMQNQFPLCHFRDRYASFQDINQDRLRT